MEHDGDRPVKTLAARGLVLLALLAGGCSHFIACHWGGTSLELPCYCADNEPYHGACPVEDTCSCIPDNPSCLPPPGACTAGGKR